MLALSGLSTIAIVRAVRGRRGVLRRVGLMCLLAAAMFLVDVRYWRCQMNVCIASEDYWANGGQHEIYYTWLWFNDLRWKGFVRWIRK